MLDKALAVVAGKVRVVGLLAAATLAGAGGGAYALASAGSTPTTIATVASHSADKPDKGSQPDNHGACVSKVAKDKSKVGGAHHNHGGAVSQAAHTCPGGDAGAKGKDDNGGDNGGPGAHNQTGLTHSSTGRSHQPSPSGTGG